MHDGSVVVADTVTVGFRYTVLVEIIFHSIDNIISGKETYGIYGSYLVVHIDGR